LVKLTSRCAVVAAVALALALSACGRKGGLDPPPSGGLADPAYAAPAGPPGPDGQPTPAPEAQPVSPGLKRRLPIDWLLD
jgi:predicted small lipoprotein YifL